MQSQFDSIINGEYTKVFVILGLSLLLSLMLIPINARVSLHKEELLKLFGSFSPEIIQKYIDTIEENISSIELSHIKPNMSISRNKINRNTNKITQDFKESAKPTQQKSLHFS